MMSFRFIVLSHVELSSIEKREILVALNYVNLVPLVLCVYDWILCLGKEIDLMWGTRFTFSTAVYFVTRYAVYPGLLFTLVELNETTPGPGYVAVGRCDEGFQFTNVDRCTPTLNFVSVMDGLSCLAMIVVLIARTYAICMRSRVVLVSFIALSLPIMILDSWSAAISTCNSLSTPKYIQLFGILSAIFQLIFDIMVMVLTFIKTKGELQFHKSLDSPEVSIIILMLYNGSIYFLVVSAIQFSNVLLYFIAPEPFNQLVTGLSGPISTLLISRFLLNLRAFMAQRNETTDTHAAQSSIVFATRRLNVTEEFGNQIYISDKPEVEVNPLVSVDLSVERRRESFSGVKKGFEA